MGRDRGHFERMNGPNLTSLNTVFYSKIVCFDMSTKINSGQTHNLGPSGQITEG